MIHTFSRLLVLGLGLLALPAVAQPEQRQNLLEIYKQAVTSDPTLAAAYSANKAVEERLAQARALFFPTLSFSMSATHSETDIRYLNNQNNPFRVGEPQSFETFAYGLNARQPIFRKQNHDQYDQAKLQVLQSGLQLIQAQQNLMLRVSDAYFDVLLARDNIELINAQKAAISGQLEMAKANFEVGTATITDVNEAQARYDLILAQEIAAVNRLETAKRALQAILGNMPPPLAGVNPSIEVTLPKPLNMEEWVEITRQNNLNINIQQRAYEIAAEEVELQNAGHYPVLDAVGSYTDTRAGGSVNGFGSDLQNGQIGLQLEIPIYQGGLVNARAREAVALRQQAMQTLEAARRQAEFETRTAYLNLTGNVAQVEALEQALVSSRSQLESTQLGYEVGVRTSVDVLNAQQQFYTAQRDLLQARYNYLLSVIQLKAATGLIDESDLADVSQRLSASSVAPVPQP
jgi:outer membrane protein